MFQAAVCMRAMACVPAKL